MSLAKRLRRRCCRIRQVDVCLEPDAASLPEPDTMEEDVARSAAGGVVRWDAF